MLSLTDVQHRSYLFGTDIVGLSSFTSLGMQRASARDKVVRYGHSRSFK